ncbi:MAG: response regulator transcription factor [Saprospiraceae bacterium]|nr:response regulator [Lewinella sp.]
MLPEPLQKEIRNLSPEGRLVVQHLIEHYQAQIATLEELIRQIKDQEFVPDHYSSFSFMEIKVSIVEDDLSFQKWILEELASAPNIRCISRHTAGEELLAQIPELQPDIVIMDLTLHGARLDGIETMLRVKLHYPNINFFVISDHNTEDKIFEALKVGAGAYLQKGDIPKKLTTLIQQFYLGGAPMSPGIARRIIDSFHKPADDLLLLDQLTPKEEEVLEYISNGFLNKEIAEKLKVVEGTVKLHLHRIYKKLQVNNRVEAIRKYLR